MKNRCCVRHCERKGVYHQFDTYRTFCEDHKGLGLKYGWRWGTRWQPVVFEARDFGIRLHEGRKVPRARRLKDRWRSA